MVGGVGGDLGLHEIRAETEMVLLAWSRWERGPRGVCNCTHVRLAYWGDMRVEGKGGRDSPHSEVRAIGNGGPSIWEVEHGAKGEMVSRTGSQSRSSYPRYPIVFETAKKRSCRREVDSRRPHEVEIDEIRAPWPVDEEFRAPCLTM